MGAKMLGIDPAAMTKCLTSRNIGSRSVILVSYKPSEAAMTRDTMAKAVYGALFKWTITKINKTLETGTAHTVRLRAPRRHRAYDRLVEPPRHKRSVQWRAERRE